MNKDILGSSGWSVSKNLGELVSGDYSIFGALIFYKELTGLTLLLLTGSETVLFELGAWGSMYVVFVCVDHSRLSST